MTRSRNLARRCGARFAWLILLLAFAFPHAARADNIAPCTTTTLNNLVGTACVIGDKLFNFTDYRDTAENYYFSQLIFTPDASNPSSPGFTLDLPPGETFSASSTSNTTLTNDIILSYTVSLDDAPPGTTFLASSVTVMGDTVSGMPLGSNELSVAENSLFPGFPCIAIAEAGTGLANLYGINPGPSTADLDCSGATSAAGTAELEVKAQNGSASITGGGFYVDQASGTVPEPSSLLLLGASLLPLFGYRTRKEKSHA